MRKLITIGFAAMFAAVIFGAWVQSDNGKAGYTNSPSENNCTSCHNSYALNSGGGSIYLTSTMSNWQYVPGTTYTINVVVKKTGLSLFGFDIEALTSANANAGTLVITNTTKTQLKNATVGGVARINVVHKSGGGASADSAIFSFNWTAPPTNIGNVTLYYTGAACNNDGNETFDYIYSGSRLVTPMVSTYSISGNVFNDANGLTDNTVNGSGTNAGGLFANLLNGSNVVVATGSVSALGAYSFSGLNAAAYTVQISTNSGTVGQTAPALVLPAGYVSTGEFLGTVAGNDGSVNGLLPVTVTNANLTNANFGIERLPVSNALTVASQSNPGGTTKVIVPALSGTDAEDGALGSGKSIKILSLPTNGVLYYNNIAVTLNQVINAYNASLLAVDPNTGAQTMTFNYTFLDAAGKTSASVATVTMPFVAVKITVTPTALATFTGTTTVPSVAQSFTISAVNLIDSVKITAPAKFQVSLSSTTGWKSSIKLPKNGQNKLLLTTIYVRYKPTAIAHDSGSVSCTSTGATAKKITVVGNCAARFESIESAEVIVAPNPVINELHILNLNIENNAKVSVYGLTGQVVLETQISPDGENSIDVSALKAGIYFCRIEDGANLITKRFVKN